MAIAVTGVDLVERRLRNMARKLPQEAAQALFAEAEIEMAEAKRRTPVDTGALRASGSVSAPKVSGAHISVVLGFGGAAVDYAIYVHENLEAFHPVGQAKYLESTLTESAPYLAQRIAKRIDLAETAR